MEEGEIILGSTAPEYMVFPIVGALIVAGCLAWHIHKSRQEKQRIGVGSVVWGVVIIAVLTFLAVWCGIQLVDADSLYLVQCVVVLTATGAVITQRERMFRALDKLDQSTMAKHGFGQGIRLVRDIALILIGSELARRALEVPWNDSVNNIAPDHVAIELTMIAIAALVGYFLSQRRSFGPGIVFGSCMILGLVQHFILQFRRAAILPADILAIQTATEVSDQYVYMLNTNDIKGIMYGGLALLCVSFIRPAHNMGLKQFVYNLCWNIPAALMCALALNWWTAVPDYGADYDLEINYWNTAASYRKQGFLPSFLTAVEDLPLPVPIGYSEENAQKITDTYVEKAKALPGRAERRAASTAQFEREKPCVVVVMNETFSDLSRLNGLGDVYEGPKFFKEGLTDTLVRGALGVSTYGGGTCNTEFECLTGNSIAFVGVGKYPYQMFNFDEVDNLARQFSQLGYTTTAIHPNAPDNWNRRATYRDMGFDEFINTKNAFENAPQFHAGATDKSTYEEVLKVLRSKDTPQFILDVTMQNHGGYRANDIPEDRRANLEFRDLDEGISAELNEYVSCIQASDEDLEWFINELRNVKRPVILTFFGDHHPSCSSAANDAYFPDEEGVQHEGRLYQTEYFVWANYDIDGTEKTNMTDDCGADLLAARTLDLVGAPLSPFQEAQLGIHTHLQVLTGIGYTGPNGRWYELGTEPSLAATYRDMANIDFLHFGSKFVNEKEQAKQEYKRENSML